MMAGKKEKNLDNNKEREQMNEKFKISNNSRRRFTFS